MTAIQSHLINFEGETWFQLLRSVDHAGNFIPPEFTFKTQGASSGDEIGYQVTFAVSNNQLRVQHFHITGIILGRQEDKIINYQVIGPKSVWDSEDRWDYFARLPAVNGKYPDVDVIRYIDTETSETVEHVAYCKYSNIEARLNFSGGLLLGNDGRHTTLPLPIEYQRVLELSFVDGELIDKTDQTPLIQQIIASSDSPAQAAISVLHHKQANGLQFKHKYDISQYQLKLSDFMMSGL